MNINEIDWTKSINEIYKESFLEMEKFEKFFYAGKLAEYASEEILKAPLEKFSEPESYNNFIEAETIKSLKILKLSQMIFESVLEKC